jgi:hypothetical protein
VVEKSTDVKRVEQLWIDAARFERRTFAQDADRIVAVQNFLDGWR